MMGFQKVEIEFRVFAVYEKRIFATKTQRPEENQ